MCANEFAALTRKPRAQSAGVVAGVGLTTHLTADARADAVLYQSSLTGVDDTELLG